MGGVLGKKGIGLLGVVRCTLFCPRHNSEGYNKDTVAEHGLRFLDVAGTGGCRGRH